MSAEEVGLQVDQIVENMVEVLSGDFTASGFEFIADLQNFQLD